MLKVIIGRCQEKRLDSLKTENQLFLDDHSFYDILNNDKKFEDKNYYYERIDILVEKITASSKEKDILIHTINPLILNWFDNETAIESFYFLNNKGDFVKFFNDEYMISKLESMGPGEIIAAHDF